MGFRDPTGLQKTEKPCKNTCVHKCFSVNKETEISAILQEVCPTECGHSGVRSRADKKRLASPGHLGSQSLGSESHSFPCTGFWTSFPDTHISQLPAELCPAERGPEDLAKYKFPMVHVTKKYRVQHGKWLSRAASWMKCRLTEIYSEPGEEGGVGVVQVRAQPEHRP